MNNYIINCIVMFLVTIVDVFICWYSVNLFLRTNWGARYTSIGNDIIIIMYCMCIFACLCSTYLLIHKSAPFSRTILVFLFLFALIPSSGFFYLNVTGKVKEIHKLETTLLEEKGQKITSSAGE